jgi:hypothetical protein
MTSATSEVPGEPLMQSLLEDQSRRWQRGERVLVESYLAQQPGLQGDPEAALDLITNEVLLRRQAGEVPRLEEYLQRFPEWATLFPDGALLPPAILPDALEVPGYEIISELGRGSRGVVYKARQVHLNRLVALKMILAGSLAGSEQRLRFLAEAEAIAVIRHPGIVQVYDFGTCGGLPYFSMEFCEAGSGWPARWPARRCRSGKRRIWSNRTEFAPAAGPVRTGHETAGAAPAGSLSLGAGGDRSARRRRQRPGGATDGTSPGQDCPGGAAALCPGSGRLSHRSVFQAS